MGEIGSGQQAQWNRALEAFDEGAGQMRQITLFPEDRAAPEAPGEAVQVRLKEFELHRPRQWGACWLALDLWEQLQLDAFWQGRLQPSPKGTSWLNVLKTLACYRLIHPGSEWRLHRQWDRSAIGDLLGEDARLADSHKLYRCLDKLVEHKEVLFTHLTERWKTLFNPRFDVLLYDLTSTYFECDPPAEGKRKHGYSRDKRPDCVQVVIALIVTPEGFPLAYEVLAGNTSDKTTLGDFLAKIEKQYGKADRIWVMDRGIPTEEMLAKMRASSPAGKLSCSCASMAFISALPSFVGITSLSATPKRPACPSRASGCPSLATFWGFPCCARFPCVHAAATSLSGPLLSSPDGSPAWGIPRRQALRPADVKELFECVRPAGFMLLFALDRFG